MKIFTIIFLLVLSTNSNANEYCNYYYTDIIRQQNDNLARCDYEYPGPRLHQMLWLCYGQVKTEASNIIRGNKDCSNYYQRVGLYPEKY